MLILVFTSSGVVQARSVVDERKTLATQEDIDGTIQRALETDEALREDVRSTLESEEVRRLAERIGLDSVTLEKAAAAVDTLQGSDLEEVASQSADLREALAGGTTVTISLVALLLIIIIVILLV